MNPRVVRVFATLAVCALAIGLVGCQDNEKPAISDRVESRVAAGATIVDFSAETDFEWDTMFVFGPYTDRASVERTLGHPWPAYDQTGIESADSFCLVVFQAAGEVVAWYDQSRAVDLDGLESRSGGYGRTEAKFSVVRDGQEVSLQAPKP